MNWLEHGNLVDDFTLVKHDHSLKASTEQMADLAPNPTTIGKQIRRRTLITEELASQLRSGVLHERRWCWKLLCAITYKSTCEAHG